MPNRLADETSPYLLQHKDNPVQWYPWCEDALNRARDEDKPIFLSIGYSACHWCHVMEHESFEDEKLAQLLNENFVSIKVDREERPDLDQIYMNAVMALQRGQGGWPLNVFLTPQQEVFFGGTYWPPAAKMGMPGFDQVLHGVLDAFLNRRDEVTRQSQQLTKWLNQQSSDEQADGKLDESVLQSATASLQQSFDHEHGGFGRAPKFPHCMDLMFLTQMANKSDAALPVTANTLLEMVRLTLKKMAYGGIFDHLAGGFARYSVDAHWLVPHFEKMLYDNALLVQVYLQMFRQTKDQFFSMIATKTLDYLLRDMLDEAGGIHSTEDADSEGVEGKFYVWSHEEVLEILGVEIGERFCSLYNVTQGGNFEGHNILNMKVSYQQFADSLEIDKQSLRDEMRAARAKLLKERNKRIRPGKDDKVLASWNALAISALAHASQLLENETYLYSAQNAANFVLQEMRDDRGRLLHTWRHGKPKVDGFLDDYAGMIVALIDLYTADGDQQWIAHANVIAEQMIEHFGDDDAGGFYFTAGDSEKLIARTKSFQDSSVPSGNSMAALGLLRLGRITGNTRFLELADLTINASTSLLQNSPLAGGQMLLALNERLAESIQIVLLANDDDARQIRNRLPVHGIPNISFVFSQPGQEPVAALSSVFAGKKMIESSPTMYVCRGQACDEPIVGNVAIQEAIAKILTSENVASLN